MEFDEEVEIEDVPQFVDPDDEFENECCFWLLKLLRGRNTGRQLKRRIFKYSLINFISSFSMLVITVTEGYNLTFFSSLLILSLLTLNSSSFSSFVKNNRK